MENKSKYSLVAGIIGIILSLFAIGPFMFFCVFAFGVAAIILGILSRRELNAITNKTKTKEKKQAKIGIILGIITVVIVVLGVLGLMMLNDVEITSKMYCPKEMGMVSDCKINEDEKTATCLYMESLEIQCYKDVLDPSQIATQAE